MLTPDTIVPDPTNPQSYNRYSYARNNPINRIDPTGHVDCSLLGDSEDTQGCNNSKQNPLPWNITEVLVKEMVFHVQSPEMERIRDGNLIEFAEFINLNWTGGLYDMKQTIMIEKGPMIMLCGTEECGWFDYSTPGNIHFGYMAASLNIPIATSDIAGGLLETITWLQTGEHSGAIIYLGENPEDAQAVRMGYTLYELFGDDLMLSEFQVALDVYWDDLQRPHPDLIMPLVISPQEAAAAYTYIPGALEFHGP